MSVGKLDTVGMSLELARIDEAHNGRVEAFARLSGVLSNLLEIEQAKEHLLDAEIFSLSITEATIRNLMRQAPNNQKGREYKAEWMGKRANLMSAIKVRKRQAEQTRKRLGKLNSMLNQVVAFNKLTDAAQEVDDG